MTLLLWTLVVLVLPLLRRFGLVRALEGILSAGGAGPYVSALLLGALLLVGLPSAVANMRADHRGVLRLRESHAELELAGRRVRIPYEESTTIRLRYKSYAVHRGDKSANRYAMWHSYTICTGCECLTLPRSAGEYGEGHRKNAALPAFSLDLAMEALRAQLSAQGDEMQI